MGQSKISGYTVDKNFYTENSIFSNPSSAEKISSGGKISSELYTSDSIFSNPSSAEKISSIEPNSIFSNIIGTKLNISEKQDYDLPEDTKTEKNIDYSRLFKSETEKEELKKLKIVSPKVLDRSGAMLDLTNVIPLIGKDLDTATLDLTSFKPNLELKSWHLVMPRKG